MGTPFSMDFGTVSSGCVTVDYTYQRALKDHKVKELIREWDEAQAGVIYVSRREDGTVAVIDGQHRLRAMESVHGGNVAVQAVVYHHLTVEQEAILFNALNGKRTQTSALEKFRSRLAYRDPVTTDIVDTVHAAGLEINWTFRSKPGHGVHAIAAVAALERIYHTGGRVWLREVLQILVDAWDGAPHSLNASALEGMLTFIGIFWPDYDHTSLTRKLSLHAPEEVLRDAGVLAKSMHSGRPSTIAFAVVVRGIYNHSRRANRLGEITDERRPRGGARIEDMLAMRAIKAGVTLPQR